MFYTYVLIASSKGGLERTKMGILQRGKHATGIMFRHRQVSTSRMQRYVTAVAAVVIAMIASMAGTIMATAADKVIHRNGFDDMPGASISVRAPLYLADATFTSTASNIQMVKGSPWVEYDDALQIKVLNENAVANNASGTHSIAGGYALKWTDVGTDADNESVDLTLTVSNIEMRAVGTTTDLVICDSSKTRGKFTLDHMPHGARYDVTVRITKHGTDTVASGTYLYGIRDIDIPHASDATWSEQVKIKEGFSTDIYLTADSTLNVTEGGTRFIATAGDDGTFTSGFAAIADPAGFTFQAGGFTGTDFFEDFGTYVIDAEVTAGRGGITSEGQTKVNWHLNKTYWMWPDTGYKTADVLVDGKSVGTVKSYAFEKVQADHNIKVSYVPIGYTIMFDKNANDATGATSSMSMSYDETKSLT